MEEGCLNAVVLYNEIKANGYAGQLLDLPLITGFCSSAVRRTGPEPKARWKWCRLCAQEFLASDPHVQQPCRFEPQARHWLDTVANVRVHGTTHEVPMQRMLQERLQAFNLIPFEEVERHPRCRPMHSSRTKRIAIPSLGGQTVSVKDEQNAQLRIYAGSTCIAEHE